MAWGLCLFHPVTLEFITLFQTTSLRALRMAMSSPLYTLSTHSPPSTHTLTRNRDGRVIGHWSDWSADHLRGPHAPTTMPCELHNSKWFIQNCSTKTNSSNCLLEKKTVTALCLCMAHQTSIDLMLGHHIYVEWSLVVCSPDSTER